MQSKAETTSASQPLDLHGTLIDPDARARLAAEFMPLVRRLCRRYRYSGVPMDDLVQVGSMGLLKPSTSSTPHGGARCWLLPSL